MESLRRIRCNERIAHYNVSQPLENIKITSMAPYSSNPKVQMEKRQVLKGRVGKEVPREVPRGHQIQCEHMGDTCSDITVIITSDVMGVYLILYLLDGEWDSKGTELVWLATLNSLGF